MPVFALYNFNDASTVIDEATDNGQQNGIYGNAPDVSGGQLHLNGVDQMAKIYGSPEFQLDRGTLEIQFTPTATNMTGNQTVLSRDSTGEHAGSFRIEVTPEGAVVITHELDGSAVVTTTEAGFYTPGDTINLNYSWDLGGEGGAVEISNLTSGGSFAAEVPDTVTMDMGDLSQPWYVGAGQANSDPWMLNNLDEHFQGSVDMISISDSVDNIGPQDQDPVANPDFATTDEDVPVVIDVLANDTGPQGQTLTVTGGSAGHGTVTLNDDGTITYTPDADWNGTDEITYSITDPDGNSSSSTVTVTVNPVNGDPVANDDTATTMVNVPVVIAPLANDTDVDGDTLVILGTPTSANGTVVVNDDGTITFTPNPGYLGDAVIDYEISDGNGGTDTAQIVVSVQSDAAPPAPDGIITGTLDNDMIGPGYVDYNGDAVDANDALIPGDGPNDDRIYAGLGHDTVFAGEGDDTVYGGGGNDLIYGGVGDDVLYGGDDNDTLYGGEGNDTLFGDDGDDLIYGGEGDNVIFGGAGNDTIHVETGGDTIFGGADRDLIVITDQAAGIGTVVDGNEDGDDYDTLDLSGAGPLRIDYDPNNPENGRVHFLDGDGNEVGFLDFSNIEHVIPCFTPGTLIATPRGEVPVESLQPGDRVITRDNGIQEVRWIGEKALSGQDLRMNSHLQPVLVKAHSLGNGLPERDMLVSPNHRLLVANDRTQLHFDEHEVLVAAKHMVGAPGISAIESIGVTYVHFMCDRHEVVLSNGAWTETFQPGDYTMRGMGNAQRNEIFELFPELKTPAGLEGFQAARRTLKRHEALILAR